MTMIYFHVIALFVGDLDQTEIQGGHNVDTRMTKWPWPTSGHISFSACLHKWKYWHCGAVIFSIDECLQANLWSYDSLSEAGIQILQLCFGSLWILKLNLLVKIWLPILYVKQQKCYNINLVNKCVFFSRAKAGVDCNISIYLFVFSVIQVVSGPV